MRSLKILAVLATLTFTNSTHASEIKVAVAANFIVPMQAIAQEYSKASGDQIIITSGASGKFFAQIENGAPFDLFFSADQSFPKKLIQKKLAEKNSEFTYAVGRLALWSADPKLVDDKGFVLHSNLFKHLAIANPALAPYGLAAEQTLKKLNLYFKVKEKLVTGENIAQTNEFIISGNAELGFIALSMITDAKKGSHWIVPQDLYAPILQDAVLLSSSKNKKASQKFLDYVKSAPVKKTIEGYGYTHPQ